MGHPIFEPIGEPEDDVNVLSEGPTASINSGKRDEAVNLRALRPRPELRVARAGGRPPALPTSR